MKHPFMLFRLNLITIALTFCLIVSCIFNYTLSQSMQESYENKDNLTFNGNKFMMTSTYLTNEVRSYVTTGYELHYNNYWNEVNKNKNREIALEKIKEIGLTDDELNLINKISSISNKLIPLEFEAMNNVKTGDFEIAISYLYGENYNNDIQTINSSREDLIEMLNKRTDIEIANIKLKIKVTQISLLCLCTLLIIMQIVGHKKNKNTLLEIDVFSGIYNRSKYGKALEQIISNKSCAIGIVSVDINGLKQVNDEYGYEYGDNLILKVVNMMKVCFSDNLFRIGGDEFVALFINGSREQFEEKVSQFRIMSEIQTIPCVSIGSSWCIDTKGLFDKIAYADELMYVDKNNYYNKTLNKSSYRATAANELSLSIISKDFFIVLQPKFHLSNGKIVGAEALVRKNGKNGKIIPPDKFISIYESDGIISLLDFFVLESVCEMIKKWKENKYPIIEVSVNFSRITILEHNVAEKINNICIKHGVDSKFITIELTERIGNIPHNDLNEILKKIQSFGFKISLDDFGRDYANLSILASIVFDEIKLDKSLIDDLATNPATCNATCCIIKMCNAYRPTKIVIEGIEAYEQVSILRELKCDLPTVQGYYFSKPISLENFSQQYFGN